MSDLAFPKPVKRFKVPKRIRRNTPIWAKRVAAKAAGTLTREEWITILKAYRFNCAYLPPSGKHRGFIEQDHIIPLSRGGTHTAENVCPACSQCNSIKGTKTWVPKPGHPFRQA